MDAVGAADGRVYLNSTRSSLQDFCQLFQIFEKDSGEACLILYIEAGILHVGGGKAHVDVLGIIAYIFPDIREKSDDVVIDPRSISWMRSTSKSAFAFDHFDSFLRNACPVSHLLRRLRSLHQALSAIHFFVPDLFHDWTCVPRYHQSSPFG